jgi:hypothetical protein
MCIKTEIKNIDFSYLGKFDVILMDPPWEEYKRRVKMVIYLIFSNFPNKQTNINSGLWRKYVNIKYFSKNTH